MKHQVQKGDTFEIIARQVYGTEKYAINISRANPQAREPLSIGSIISVPRLPEDPSTDLPSSDAGSVNEVTLQIDGVRFRYWSNMTIERSLDSFDTVTFDAPLTVTDGSQRNAFKPFAYQTVIISVGGAPLFLGTIIDMTPSLDPDAGTVSISAYSVPAVLGDCHLPVSSFPFQFEDGITLEQIARWVAERFGISVVFETKPESNFPDKVKCETTQTVLDFLATMARQQGLIISNTPSGELLFRQSKPSGSAVAKLRQGIPPLLSVTSAFNHSAYYSQITGIKSTNIGTDGSLYTVDNERLQGVIRPFNVNVKDSASGDVQVAAQTALGRMFGNSVSYSLSVATWRAPTGDLWEPNQTVTLYAPSAFVYTPYDLIITEVSLSRNTNQEIAELTLTLPSAFTSEIPEVLPWD